MCEVWLQAHAWDNVHTNYLGNSLVANLTQITPQLRIVIYVKFVPGQVLPMVPVVFAVWLQSL